MQHKVLYSLTTKLNNYWLGEKTMRANNEVKVTELFDITRYPKELSLFKKILLLCYAPVGVILCILRLILFVMCSCVFICLPKNQKNKQRYMKCISLIMGLIGIFNNENSINTNAIPKFIVINHTYTFEFLPFLAKYHCLITGRKAVTENKIAHVFKQLIESVTVDDLISKYAEIAKMNIPILICPEGATTNGKVGLLKYNPLVFFYGESILPIAVRVLRPLPIACCRLHLALLIDFLWLLYVPWTLCEYNILPEQKIHSDELPNEFAARVQVMTANTLGLLATDFTVEDKNALRLQDKGVTKNTQ